MPYQPQRIPALWHVSVVLTSNIADPPESHVTLTYPDGRTFTLQLYAPANFERSNNAIRAKVDCAAEMTESGLIV